MNNRECPGTGQPVRITAKGYVCAVCSEPVPSCVKLTRGLMLWHSQPSSAPAPAPPAPPPHAAGVSSLVAALCLLGAGLVANPVYGSPDIGKTPAAAPFSYGGGPDVGSPPAAPKTKTDPKDPPPPQETPFTTSDAAPIVTAQPGPDPWAGMDRRLIAALIVLVVWLTATGLHFSQQRRRP